MTDVRTYKLELMADYDTAEKIKKLAEQDNRTISTYLYLLIKDALKEKK